METKTEKIKKCAMKLMKKRNMSEKGARKVCKGLIERGK